MPAANPSVTIVVPTYNERENLTPLVERGGYIPFCDHRCPPDVKPEYYLYYLDLKEEMFGM